MQLPKHIHLSIEHQPHAVNYQTVEQFLAEHEDDDLAAEDRAAMLATGEVWQIQWYPNTPVGFEVVQAATLARALELALQIEKRDEEWRLRDQAAGSPTVVQNVGS